MTAIALVVVVCIAVGLALALRRARQQLREANLEMMSMRENHVADINWALAQELAQPSPPPPWVRLLSPVSKPVSLTRDDDPAHTRATAVGAPPLTVLRRAANTGEGGDLPDRQEEIRAAASRADTRRRTDRDPTSSAARTAEASRARRGGGDARQRAAYGAKPPSEDE